MIRIVDWNVSYQGNSKAKIGLLKKITNELGEGYPCIIAMQEVTESIHFDITRDDIFSNYAYSLNLRSPGQYEERNRSLGCLVACTGGIKIIDSSLIDRAPFPERTLCVHARLGQIVFEIVCFHSLTGVGFKKAKSAQFAALADYLSLKQGKPAILCCDLNEPQIDHYDLSRVKLFDQQGDGGLAASYILGNSPVHGLRDTYRVWLTKNPEKLRKIKEMQDLSEDLASTPMQISHLAGSKNAKRYDYIFCSEHWEVNHVEYRFQEAINVGSDHALVTADLEWK